MLHFLQNLFKTWGSSILSFFYNVERKLLLRREKDDRWPFRFSGFTKPSKKELQILKTAFFVANHGNKPNALKSITSYIFNNYKTFLPSYINESYRVECLRPAIRKRDAHENISTKFMIRHYFKQSFQNLAIPSNWRNKWR